MKKALYLVAAAAVLAAGCTKEMDSPVKEPVAGTKVTIKASVEQEADSKTTYVDDKTLNWVAGDQIGVRVSGESGGEAYAYDQYFDLTGGEGTATGEFSWTLKDENKEQYGTLAFYPWTGWADGNAETDGTNLGGDGKLYFHLFPTLTYVEGQNLMPLLANLGDEVNPKAINFKHVGGAVKIALKDVPARANKVTLTIAGQNITGWFVIEDWKAEGAKLEASEGTNDTVTITFDTAEDVRDMTFYFPVPTTAVPSVKVAVLADTEEIWSKTSTKAQPAIERGQILRMPELTVTDPASTYYLVGHLDGADYEGFAYPFVDGQLKVTFESEENYVYIINGQGLRYWFPEYVTAQEGTLYQWGDQSAKGQKMFVPGNKEVTFTLVDNKDADKSLTLSWEILPTLDLVWGMYSTDSDNLWSYAIKGEWAAFNASGQARSVAMDDEYIYLPKSSASAAVFAVKIDDNTNVTELPTSGFAGTTFATSFARVMKNTDPTVNGGKDVLLVSNLTAGDVAKPFEVRAYKKGIDQASERMAAFIWDTANNVNDWRRYGDRFFVTGTYQNGALYCPSFNPSKTVILEVTNGDRSGLKQIWTAEKADGIMDATVYPGGSNILFTNASTGLNAVADGGVSDSGWETYPGTTVDAAKGTFGYNFFSFNGVDYIARVKMASGTKAYLQIFKDTEGTEAGFLTAIAGEPLFNVPIQNVDDEDAKVYSSLVDCAVRVMEDKVYIAALFQNASLCLYELK